MTICVGATVATVGNPHTAVPAIRDRCHGGQSANLTYDKEITDIAALKKGIATSVLQNAL